jgi:hypothetical protein
MLQQEVWRRPSVDAAQHDCGDEGDHVSGCDHRRPPMGADDDIIRECYGSAEFKEGVEALNGRLKPEPVGLSGC